MRYLLLTIGVLSATAFADDRIGVPEIPISQCTVSNASVAYSMWNTERQAQLGETTLPLVRTWKKLAAKAAANAPDSKRPINELLSKPDLDAFDKASQDYAHVESWMYTESARARDIEYLAHTAELIDNEFRWDKTPAENSDDDYLLTMAGALSVLLKSKAEPPPENDQKCSFGLSLENEANDLFASLGPDLPQRVDDAQKIIVTMQITYGKRPPAEILTDPHITALDKVKLDKVMLETIYPLQRFMKAVSYLQALQWMNIASIAVYSSRVEFLKSGQHSNMPGAFTSLESDPNTPEQVNIALRLLDKMSMKFPSEHEKMLKQLGEVAKQHQ